MDELNLLQRLVIWILPVLFAITVHEAAHGWMALRLGDQTAMMLGRVTLNPLKHIDLVGTLLVPGLMLMMGGMLFGWAKPVPVTWKNLRNRKRDMALVALAGPAANLLMAIFWALTMKFSLMLSTSFPAIAKPLLYMGGAGISINLVLMVLNLLPIPPLDGSRIVSALLPDKWAWRYNLLEKYGMVILLVLLFSGVLWGLINGPVHILKSLLYLLAGVQ